MSKPSFAFSDANREIAATWCVRLSEGPLNAADREEFEAWLRADPENAALLERTVVAWQAIEDQASDPEMIFMRSQALENVGIANRQRWTRPRFSWRLFTAIAATILIMVSGLTAWHLMPTTYETGIGERRVVALTDGSTISLDAATRLKVRYLADRRELWLEAGRAKFSVAKDPLRPFSVQAGDRMIVATGTQFSVEKLAGQVRVLLYEGHVSVLDTGGAFAKAVPVRFGKRRETAEQALLPGREMLMTDRQPTALVEQIDPGKSVSWEAGLLEFTDEPLGIAVQRMNRYATTKMRIATPTDGEIPISGQFNGGDSSAFVEGVTAVFPVIASRDPDGTIVFRTRDK